MAFLEAPGVIGWRGFRRATEAASDPDVLVVGAPTDLGAGANKGAALGPDKIRDISNSMKSINRAAHDLSALRILDAGNLILSGLTLEQLPERVSAVFGELFSRFKCPIVALGGDHSVTFPIVAAARRRRRIGLVWFDAHPDVLDSCHGSRWSHGSPVRRIIDTGMAPADVLLVGTRAYDPTEPDYLMEHAVPEIRAIDFFENYDLAVRRFASLIESLTQRVDRLYVSIDIDVLDDCHAPATGTPVSGGLSTAMLLRLLSLLPSDVAGYDIVEFAPPLDFSACTARAIKEILLEVFSRIGASE